MFTLASLSLAIIPIIVMAVIGAFGSALVSTLFFTGSLAAALGVLAAIFGLGATIFTMESKQMAKIRDVIDISASKRLIKFTSRRK